jgi:hypothetical protein
MIQKQLKKIVLVLLFPIFVGLICIGYAFVYIGQNGKPYKSVPHNVSISKL